MIQVRYWTEVGGSRRSLTFLELICPNPLMHSNFPLVSIKASQSTKNDFLMMRVVDSWLRCSITTHEISLQCHICASIGSPGHYLQGICIPMYYINRIVIGGLSISLEASRVNRGTSAVRFSTVPSLSNAALG